MAANTPQDYLNFLLEVLRKVADDPTPQSIYPFLAQNLDKLDENLLKLLLDVDENMLVFLEVLSGDMLRRLAKQQEDVFGLTTARLIGNFGHLLSDFPKGDASTNKEIVIACYRVALTVFRQNTIPEGWASFQHRLGTGYLERIKGNQSQNLEQAIIAFENALKIYTIEQFPQDWASTQYNLAYAYSEANNLEMAIVDCNEALKVWTFDKFPKKWANTQQLLGNAYRQRTKGDKNSNLAEAIKAFQSALRVYNRETFPRQWAAIQADLGAVYRNKTGEDYAENLEVAIKKYEASLQVITFTNSPRDWATIQDNLGVAYSHKIKGDRSDNLERAIASHLEALKVFSMSLYPKQWAMIQINMGNAYRDRITFIKGKENKLANFNKAVECFENVLKILNSSQGFPQEWVKMMSIKTQNNFGIVHSFNIDLFDTEEDRDKMIETAIIAFQTALQICTQKDNPIDWANIHDNLASTFCNRIGGNKSENLERAIYHHQEALKVRTPDAFPYEWATTQNNLATAYIQLADIGSSTARKTANLEKAINSLDNALKICTKENDPLKCLMNARNLANLHYREKQWKPATEAYHIAIEALENARLEALNPHSRQEVLSNAIDVFHRIVQAHLNLNQPEKALEYIERSKGRNLVELMTQKNLQPQGVSQEIIDQLNELKQKVVNEQIRLQHQSMNQNLMRSDNLTPYIQDHSYLKEYQQDLDNFIEREIKTIDPLFSLNQKVEPIPFTDIQALTNAETCLLQWYITGEKILAFVVSADGEVKYWQSSEVDRNKLIDTISNYLQLYYSKNGKKEWINQLPKILQTFANVLHINNIITLIPNICKRLIIIPHWFLHILPLHALPINDSPLFKGGWALFNGGWGGSILQDKYNVQYAPSCQLLKITQQRQLHELTNLFAIQNPQNNLFFTDLEVEIIKNLFFQSEVLAKQNATKTAIKTHQNFPLANCIHFSCHGTFNPNNPLESALILTKDPTDQEDGYLRLGEIFKLNFKNCRLVTLSACETGLIDLKSISDEYIGLPSGFLFAGSPSVVSSLWKVEELSTTFLLIKFYETLPQNPQKGEIAVTLKNAQKWLQTLTLEQVEQELEKLQPQLEEIMNKLGGGKRPIFNESLKQIRQRQPHPFENPYYWAGFIATGF